MSFVTRATRISPSIVLRAQQRATAAGACFSTQNAAESEPQIYPVYVHHLSKICLEHLQNFQSDWLEKEGLATGLHIKNDGTFTLNYPRTDPNVDSGRIWTSYDAEKKQHWLSVYRQRLVGRFLIKDSQPGESIDAVKSDVKATVDQMIRTLSEMENKST